MVLVIEVDIKLGEFVLRLCSCSKCIVDSADVECDDVDDIVIAEEICDVFMRLPPICTECGTVEEEDEVSVVEYQGLVRMRHRCLGDGAAAQKQSNTLSNEFASNYKLTFKSF